MGRFSLFRNIVLGARRSTLAKLQAYHVGIELSKKFPDIKIQFHFQESSGDKDLTSPLWKMEGKGVFTRDLQEELIKGNIHCIVHSWKDLDLEDREETNVHSVLKREDQRDVFLFKKSVWEEVQQFPSGDVSSSNSHSSSLPNKLVICTSSPRREFNLSKFFPDFLPKSLRDIPIEFTSIRGNIQTRMRKFLEGDYAGLIMAKAGIDRLLSFPDTIQNLEPRLQSIIPDEDKKEFQEISHLIRSYLDQMMVMILPLSLNPNAPAQGALAVEVLKKDMELGELFTELTDPNTNSNTQLERKILGKFGGGCHQKIGVAILSRDWGRIQFMRGLTDSGLHLNTKNVLQESDEPGSIETSKQKYPRKNVWPPNGKMLNRKRKELNAKLPEKADLFVARKSALSDEHVAFLKNSQSMKKILWTAGTGTWRDLAERDLWVHGTTDSLGETESPDIETIIGRKTNFIKLTHNLTREETSLYPILTTYDALGFEDIPNIDPHSIQAAFWRSGSEFDTITEKYPELKNVVHYCGVGSTYNYLRSKGLDPIPYYNFKDWEDSLAP